MWKADSEESSECKSEFTWDVELEDNFVEIMDYRKKDTLILGHISLEIAAAAVVIWA